MSRIPVSSIKAHYTSFKIKNKSGIKTAFKVMGQLYPFRKIITRLHQPILLLFVHYIADITLTFPVQSQNSIPRSYFRFGGQFLHRHTTGLLEVKKPKGFLEFGFYLVYLVNFLIFGYYHIIVQYFGFAQIQPRIMEHHPAVAGKNEPLGQLILYLVDIFQIYVSGRGGGLFSGLFLKKSDQVLRGVINGLLDLFFLLYGYFLSVLDDQIRGIQSGMR